MASLTSDSMLQCAVNEKVYIASGRAECLKQQHKLSFLLRIVSLAMNLLACLLPVAGPCGAGGSTHAHTLALSGSKSIPVALELNSKIRVRNLAMLAMSVGQGGMSTPRATKSRCAALAAKVQRALHQAKDTPVSML